MRYVTIEEIIGFEVLDTVLFVQQRQFSSSQLPLFSHWQKLYTQIVYLLRSTRHVNSQEKILRPKPWN